MGILVMLHSHCPSAVPPTPVPRSHPLPFALSSATRLVAKPAAAASGSRRSRRRGPLTPRRALPSPLAPRRAGLPSPRAATPSHDGIAPAGLPRRRPSPQREGLAVRLRRRLPRVRLIPAHHGHRPRGARNQLYKGN